MRSGAWGKALAIVALIGLVGLTTGAAVSEHSGLNWDEVKAVQATERTEMNRAQS